LAKWVLCVPLFVCLLMSGFSLYESVRVTERERERERERETESDKEVFLQLNGW
jgi:hypothetical protein